MAVTLGLACTGKTKVMSGNFWSKSFAAKQILKVQADESVSLRQLLFGFEVGVGPKRDESAGELERLFAL